MPTNRTPIKPPTKVNITPRALEIFKRALLAQDEHARKDAEGDLMAELRLETWEFISRRAHYPNTRYVSVAALPDQLEQVLAKALHRPEGLADY